MSAYYWMTGFMIFLAALGVQQDNPVGLLVGLVFCGILATKRVWWDNR